MPTPFLPSELVSRIADCLTTREPSSQALARLCLVDRRCCLIAQPRLYATAKVILSEQWGNSGMTQSTALLIQTFKNRPPLASFVKSVIVDATEIGGTHHENYGGQISPSLALTAALTLTSDVQSLIVAMDDPPFRLFAHTLLSLQPTLRVLDLSNPAYEGRFQSQTTVELLRGLPCLQELSISGISITPQDAVDPPTFRLTKLIFQTPDDSTHLITSGRPVPGLAFNFITSFSTESLRELHLTACDYLDLGGAASTTEDLSTLSALERFEVTAGQILEEYIWEREDFDGAPSSLLTVASELD
ncbi:hypothetical protein P7C70_g5840, partial [Phenoliferia sp. Uapishka_3]